MIDRPEIDEMAQRLGVHASAVQRDYVCGWLLAAIFGGGWLGERLVLKGGNCLRKGYFESGRYSEDLDFSCGGWIPEARLRAELNALCPLVTERAGVHFDVDATRVAHRRNLDGGRSVTEARVYFRDFYGAESELRLKVKLDVTQFDRLHLAPVRRPLIHPYSDAGECAVTMRCVRLEEVLATKLRCLLQRKHSGDFFDLVYGPLSAGAVSLDLRTLIDVFYRVTVFGENPLVAKGLFVDLPFGEMGGDWERFIVCPRASRVPFDQAKDAFLGLIERLIRGEPQRTRSSVFFPSVLRRPIMRAADTMTLLRMEYDGFERLVEPYELAFKIRKEGASPRAREYLYVYDTTGGRSGPGIKCFVSDKVGGASNTDHGFVPRCLVELKKAGSAEPVSTFARRTD